MDTGGSTLVQSGSSSSSEEQPKQQKQQKKQKKQKQDDAELIPRSMSDIYKISIQNRNKRDSGGSGVDDEDDVEDEKLEDMEDDEEADGPIFSKTGTKDNESDVEFMTRLGWVEQGTEMYGRVKRAEAQSGGVNTPGGGNRGSDKHGEDGGDKEKKQRRRGPKQRGKRTSEASYDYGQAAGAYGASAHGSDPSRLSKSSAGSRNHYDSNRKGRGGGRGGRSFVGEERQRSGGGGGRGGRGGNRRPTTSRR